MKKIILSAVALTILLASCKQPDSVTNINNYTLYKDAEEESYDFITELAPVYRSEKSTDDSSETTEYISDTMLLRFYEGNKYIPYVAAQYYMEHFADIPIVSSSYNNHKYKFYGRKIDGKSFDIIFDAEKDTIYLPDCVNFINPTDDDNKNASIAVPSFLLKLISSEIVTFQNQKPITFDLLKYGFKTYGATEDVYVPLSVMNLLFSCLEYANFSYTGDAVHYYDTSENSKYNSFANSSWYKDKNGNLIDRPKELIEASYNLLCFSHEYIYGHPGYYGFADTEKKGYADQEIVKKADAMTLDEILDTYASDVKEQLLSTSYKDYVTGIRSLFYYVYGDVHASPSSVMHDLFDTETNISMAQEMKLSPKVIRIYNLDNKTSLEKLREEAGKTEGLELLSDGKTAVIRFDSFDIDVPGWSTYYTSNPSVNPDPEAVSIPDDTIGLMYKSFYTLLNNDSYKNVTNVIFDISTNGGGVVSVASCVATYITEAFSRYEKNVLTNIRFIYNSSLFDMNLDGKVDKEDEKYGKKIRDTFNFAILTSFGSFSSGNMLPCVCADAGIPIIGEQSGGGSCAVILGATADGFPYRLSKTMRFEHADGTSCENGAPVTIEMPYEDFYNDAKLIDVMNKLYNDKN